MVTNDYPALMEQNRVAGAEFDRKGTIDLAAFYQRRAWRLLPAILASIVGTFAVGAALELDWFTWQRAAASLLFFQNSWGVHEPFHGPLMQHWSLAVEEHFYLIAPACLLWFGRRRWRGIVATLAAVLVFSDGRSILKTVLNWRPVVFIGQISFALYCSTT